MDIIDILVNYIQENSDEEFEENDKHSIISAV